MGRSSLDTLQLAVENSFGELPYSSEAPRRKKINPNLMIECITSRQHMSRPSLCVFIN